MDQVIEQSPITDTATDNIDSTPETAQEPAATHDEDSKEAFDYKSLGEMETPDAQMAALKAAGIFNDDVPEQKPEPETKPEAETKPEEQSDDPLVTVKVNGEEIQVKQSELIAGYQRGADYTRKTQELAAERKRYDELLAKVAGAR